MAVITANPKGTQDITPLQSYKWQEVEGILSCIAQGYNYKLIRTPTFEHTELFLRGVGETTDVVSKEMYTFIDKGERSVTLKPEGTAGVMRASIQNGLLNEALPLKLFYITPCFRYEKPQAFRYRELHQFGIELLGSASPSADVEVISFAQNAFRSLGLEKNISLEINSIGCKECRPNFHTALKEYFMQHKESLCETCLERLEKNPMRILDCKSPICQDIAKNAPKGLDYLCENCSNHFDEVKKQLLLLNISFVVNSSIVRGLDYYTKTVFEFVTDVLGSQSAVCGGGRYDGLVEELGGKAVCGIGFGMGLERLIGVCDKSGFFKEMPSADLYIGCVGEEYRADTQKLIHEIRMLNEISVEGDLMERSVKNQMQYANKIKANYVLLYGESEHNSSQFNIKNMRTTENFVVDCKGNNVADEIVCQITLNMMM